MYEKYVEFEKFNVEYLIISEYLLTIHFLFKTINHINNKVFNILI